MIDTIFAGITAASTATVAGFIVWLWWVNKQEERKEKDPNHVDF